MKKLISLMMALAMCFALLTACSSGDSGSGDSGSGDSGDSGPVENTGETYTFNVVNGDSATSLCETYVETICNAISEESNGQLKFNYYPGGSMFGATEIPDAVKDGAADICWSTTAFFGGLFPISEFMNLPANGVTCARMGTAVYNTMLQEIPECAAELEDWHVLAAHACTYAPICTTSKKIETPADFQGLQIRAAGTIPTMYINALGATAVTMPTSDVYESLSKNVIQGMANDWHNIDCFKLYETIDYCLDTPVNETACFVLMNQAKYDSLPDDLKAIFDKYSESGFMSDMAGYYWDSCNFWVGDLMEENGVEIYEPSQELYDFMNSDEIKAQVHQEDINYLNGFGIDGQAMYDKCMEIVSRFADQYTDPYATEFNYTDWDLSTVDGYQASWLAAE